MIFFREVKIISIVIVKKETNKITIGCDSQETFGDGYQVNLGNSKIKEVDKGIYVASVGDANLSNLLYTYLERFSLSSITNSFELVEFFREFSEWATKYLEVPPDKTSLISLCQFILIINEDVWFFSDYYTRKIENGEYYAIGAGSPAAFACMHVGASVEDALKAVCKVDIYCSEPIEVIVTK